VSRLHYLIGDATEPVHKPAIICHVNNDLGGWGRGFVLALSAKYPEAEKAYRQWKLSYDARIPNTTPFTLGSVQFVATGNSIHIANMIAQHDVVWMNKIPPIRYGALESCLTEVYRRAPEMGVTVHMPRIGADLAGGEWPKIEDIIKKTMTVDSYVYTLKNQRDRWPTVYET